MTIVAKTISFVRKQFELVLCAGKVMNNRLCMTWDTEVNLRT